MIAKMITTKLICAGITAGLLGAVGCGVYDEYAERERVKRAIMQDVPRTWNEMQTAIQRYQQSK